MRIAILNKYQNKVFRGAETFVFELAKRLSKNHDVDIVSDVNYFKLLKNKYDIIIPTNGRCQAILVRIISWLTKAKMIVSGQSGPGWDDRVNLYTFPDVFVALSEHQAAWARRVNPLVKVATIPNGVDLNRFKKVGTLREKDLGLKNKTRTVLSVGAFTKEKRHELTIKAVAKIPDVKLKIVGGGGDRYMDIKILGEKVLGKDRFEISSVSPEKMPEIYKKADVLAFPSVPWESFGIVMAEAMATGIPIVATNDPIRREIIGDAGLLVDPTDIDAYAKTIKLTLDRKWANVPRIQAEKYSWDVIAKKYEDLFKEITK